MKRIKRLCKGVKRLLLVISVIISIIALLISNGNVNWDCTPVFIGIGYCFAFGAGTFLSFWLITRLIIWIVDGFNEQKK